MRAWNWLALRASPRSKPASDDKLQTRGQYLVEGAGHCAACHSPRTAFMAQDGTVARDAAFLSGGVLDGWTAPALRGADSAIATWSTARVADYLATGRNTHATASGEMALAIEHSLQYLSDDDLQTRWPAPESMDGKPVQDIPRRSPCPAPTPSRRPKPTKRGRPQPG